MDPRPDLSPLLAGWSLTVNQTGYCHRPGPAQVLLDCALATEVPATICAAATLSSQLGFPCGTAPVLLLPGSCVRSSSGKFSTGNSPQMLWNAMWRHWSLYSKCKWGLWSMVPCLWFHLYSLTIVVKHNRGRRPFFRSFSFLQTTSFLPEWVRFPSVNSHLYLNLV